MQRRGLLEMNIKYKSVVVVQFDFKLFFSRVFCVLHFYVFFFSVCISLLFNERGFLWEK